MVLAVSWVTRELVERGGGGGYDARSLVIAALVPLIALLVGLLIGWLNSRGR